jgi:hypothetical protein
LPSSSRILGADLLPIIACLPRPYSCNIDHVSICIYRQMSTERQGPNVHCVIYLQFAYTQHAKLVEVDDGRRARGELLGHSLAQSLQLLHHSTTRVVFPAFSFDPLAELHGPRRRRKPSHADGKFYQRFTNSSGIVTNLPITKSTTQKDCTFSLQHLHTGLRIMQQTTWFISLLRFALSRLPPPMAICSSSATFRAHVQPPARESKSESRDPLFNAIAGQLVHTHAIAHSLRKSTGEGPGVCDKMACKGAHLRVGASLEAVMW